MHSHASTRQQQHCCGSSSSTSSSTSSRRCSCCCLSSHITSVHQEHHDHTAFIESVLATSNAVCLTCCRYHPGIVGAHATKEVNFFNKVPATTANSTLQHSYFSSFPGVDMSVDDPLAGRCSYPAQLGLSSSSRPALVRMEATAMYLAHPWAAGNVRQLLPEVTSNLVANSAVETYVHSCCAVARHAMRFNMCHASPVHLLGLLRSCLIIAFS
jgi:hypothetical protein